MAFQLEFLSQLLEKQTFLGYVNLRVNYEAYLDRLAIKATRAQGWLLCSTLRC